MPLSLIGIHLVGLPTAGALVIVAALAPALFVNDVFVAIRVEEFMVNELFDTIAPVAATENWTVVDDNLKSIKLPVHDVGPFAPYTVPLFVPLLQLVTLAIVPQLARYCG